MTVFAWWRIRSLPQDRPRPKNAMLTGQVPTDVPRERRSETQESASENPRR